MDKVHVLLFNFVCFCVAFKFGDFVLKSGEHSPVYFDLRVIVSYPKVMDELTDLMKDFMEDKQIVSEQLCGVPYTGMLLSSIHGVKFTFIFVSSSTNCNIIVC